MRTLKSRCSGILHGPGEPCHVSLHTTFFALFSPLLMGKDPVKKTCGEAGSSLPASQ